MSVVKALAIFVAASVVLGLTLVVAGPGETVAPRAGAYADLQRDLESRGMSLANIDAGVSVVDLLNMNFSELVARSSDVVEIEVTEVSNPRWTSVDGEEFELEIGVTPIAPLQYRVVSAIVRDAPVGELRTGDEIEFMIWGSGSSEGNEIYLDLPSGAIVSELLSGDFVRGDRKYVLLEKHDLHLLGSMNEVVKQPVLKLVEYYRGQWTIQPDDSLTSLDARRDVADRADFRNLVVSAHIGSREVVLIEARTTTHHSPFGDDTLIGYSIAENDHHEGDHNHSHDHVDPPAEERPVDAKLEFRDGMYRCVGEDCAPDAKEWRQLPAAVTAETVVAPLG